MLKRILTAGLLVITAAFTQAEEAPRYVEGEHYTVLEKPLRTSYKGEEIGEIMEFFSYNCIHCANLEPGIDRYLAQKPEDIRFTSVPVVFNEYQKGEVRAYYVVELLKLGKDAHMQIFNEIHNNRASLRTDKQFAKFFTRFGISEEDYSKYAYSFAVNSKLNASMIMTRDSQIGGTPAILANGKYLIKTDVVGNEAALYVAQWLVQNPPQE